MLFAADGVRAGEDGHIVGGINFLHGRALRGNVHGVKVFGVDGCLGLRSLGLDHGSLRGFGSLGDRGRLRNGGRRGSLRGGFRGGFRDGSLGGLLGHRDIAAVAILAALEDVALAVHDGLSGQEILPAELLSRLGHQGIQVPALWQVENANLGIAEGIIGQGLQGSRQIQIADVAPPEGLLADGHGANQLHIGHFHKFLGTVSQGKGSFGNLGSVQGQACDIGLFKGTRSQGSRLRNVHRAQIGAKCESHRLDLNAGHIGLIGADARFLEGILTDDGCVFQTGHNLQGFLLPHKPIRNLRHTGGKGYINQIVHPIEGPAMQRHTRVLENDLPDGGSGQGVLSNAMGIAQIQLLQRLTPIEGIDVEVTDLGVYGFQIGTLGEAPDRHVQGGSGIQRLQRGILAEDMAAHAADIHQVQGGYPILVFFPGVGIPFGQFAAAGDNARVILALVGDGQSTAVILPVQILSPSVLPGAAVPGGIRGIGLGLIGHTQQPVVRPQDEDLHHGQAAHVGQSLTGEIEGLPMGSRNLASRTDQELSALAVAGEYQVTVNVGIRVQRDSDHFSQGIHVHIRDAHRARVAVVQGKGRGGNQGHQHDQRQEQG